MFGNKKPKLEEILNECLERMGRGATVEECIKSYPEQAEELGPLLRTATALRTTLRAEARPEARASAMERLRQAMDQPARRRWRLPTRVPAPVWAAAVLVLVLSAGGFGVVQASSDTLPGDTFYPVKRTVERVRLNWPFRSEESKARYSEELARRRAEELARLAAHREPAYFATLSERIASNVDRSVAFSFSQVEERQREIAGRIGASQADPERLAQRRRFIREENLRRLETVKARLQADLELNLRRLQAALQAAPDASKAIIERAIDRLTKPYQVAVQRIDSRIEQLKRGDGPGPALPQRPVGVPQDQATPVYR